MIENILMVIAVLLTVISIIRITLKSIVLTISRVPVGVNYYLEIILLTNGLSYLIWYIN